MTPLIALQPTERPVTPAGTTSRPSLVQPNPVSRETAAGISLGVLSALLLALLAVLYVRARARRGVEAGQKPGGLSGGQDG